MRRVTALILLVALIAACPAWSQNIDGQAGGGASLTVKENDNIPNVSGVSSISFTNGTVTDDGAVTGNASTATALAANGSNCSAGQAPLGVNASGAVETCTDYQEEPASNWLVAKTAANTSAARTITGTASEITVTNGDGVSGNPTLSLPSSIDLGGKTLEIPNSTTLPATCGVGQIYMDTDATSGQRLYLCQASNTWALQGDGGGGGSSSTGSANAVQTADGAGAFTDSGCTATGGAMTCSGGFTSGGAGVGIVTMKEGTAPDGVIRGEDGTWDRGAFDFVAGGGGGSSHAISGSVALSGGVVLQ